MNIQEAHIVVIVQLLWLFLTHCLYTYLNFGISMIACHDDQLLLVKMPFSDLARCMEQIDLRVPYQTKMKTNFN
ncbi:hypothetical protein T11_12343 [Trichinella zimbabwensis]|uniref:Uncharacterized protein n=1 Tax=Trichinella zimbabwensis TaxID=268475 RepID=A0A0V1HYJ7_9BILA|nr:hypothetical protein T11_12343 [Trichinella zimbabwensis]